MVTIEVGVGLVRADLADQLDLDPADAVAVERHRLRRLEVHDGPLDPVGHALDLDDGLDNGALVEGFGQLASARPGEWSAIPCTGTGPRRAAHAFSGGSGTSTETESFAIRYVRLRLRIDLVGGISAASLALVGTFLTALACPCRRRSWQRPAPCRRSRRTCPASSRRRCRRPCRSPCSTLSAFLRCRTSLALSRNPIGSPFSVPVAPPRQSCTDARSPQPPRFAEDPSLHPPDRLDERRRRPGRCRSPIDVIATLDGSSMNFSRASGIAKITT